MRLIAALFCLYAAMAAQAAPVCIDPGQGVPDRHAEAGGVGGTGHGPGDAGGIGGTGAPLADGIGGTGARRAPAARVGVVGVVTGFGSICVNGLRLQYDRSAMVSENGRPAGTAALAVGQFVSIEAERVGDALIARDIGIVQLLEGPLSARREDGGFEVMGQPVLLLPDARVDEGGRPLQPGDMVKVSGMRAPGGRVHASRIERAPALDLASVIGDVSHDHDVLGIDGLPVQGTLDESAESPTRQLLARGHWDGRVLRIRETRMDPSLRFADRVGNVVLEALVSGRLDDGSLNGCGLQVVGSPSARLRGIVASEALEVRRVRMTGRIAPDGRFVADEVDALPGGQPMPVR